MMKRITSWLETKDSRALIFMPINTAIVFDELLAIVVKAVDDPLPIWVGNVFFVALAAVVCLSGIMQMIKKEIPATPLRGRNAITVGMVWTISWGVVGIINAWGLLAGRSGSKELNRKSV